MLGTDPRGGFGNFISPLNTFSPTDVEQKIIDLLVNAGGLANLPKRDRIEARRGTSSIITFYEDTHHYNRYSLLEFDLSGTSQMLSQNSHNEWGSSSDLKWKLLGGLRFPDFKHVTVYRRADNSAKQTAIKIDVDEILNSGDCSKDVWLDWGDVIEIPETDHPVDEKWPGLPDQAVVALIKCTAREVTLKIKGESATLKLASQFVGIAGSF